MINAQVVKGVEELLSQRGVHMQNDERLGDTLARSLGISPKQAEVLLESLHDGCSVEEAKRRANILSLGEQHSELLNDLARRIGSALGRLTA